jgi:hypothetical protein
VANYKESPEPTEEDINRAMESAAAQLGEKFERDDSAESDDKIVSRWEKEGWILVDIATSGIKVNAVERPDKEAMVIGRGNRFLVFERTKNDLHGKFDYE